jgi:hypothetical protein
MQLPQPYFGTWTRMETGSSNAPGVENSSAAPFSPSLATYVLHPEQCDALTSV